MGIEIALRSDKRLEEVLREAREILRALELPTAEALDSDLVKILMFIGLGALRARKRQQDELRAAQEMERRIQAGPRPSREETGLN